MTESVHALSGAYVVDALDDQERELFERHLPGCLDCRQEVDSLREGAAVLADAVAAPAPPHLRDSVLAGIRHVRPLPPETDRSQDDLHPGPPAEPSVAEKSEAAEPTNVVPLRRRAFSPGRLVAAAAAVIVIGAGVVYQPWQDDSSVSTISAADQVLTAPDAQKVSVDFTDGSRADVYRSKSKGQAVIVTHDMAAPPTGKAFEVWLRDAGSDTVRPAGLMTKAGDNKVLLRGDATDADWVGITVEPAGGSPQPTSKPIAKFELDEGAA